MKISNFNLLNVTGTSPINWRFKASVDVTTRPFPYIKQITKEAIICKTYAGNWSFLDSGEFTPGVNVERLERAYENTHERSLELCPVVSF